LLRQAYFEKTINLEEARPLDRDWCRKWQWTMAWIEQANWQKLAAVEHDLHCGALTYLAGQKTLDTHWEQAIALQSRMKSCLFPWLESETKNAYRSLNEAWERAYGRMDDPEIQKKVAESTARLLNRAKNSAASNNRASHNTRIS
jgi:hypothetical protein